MFYVILRRETGLYVAKGGLEVNFLSMAVRYKSREHATDNMGPNTCVCGPYSTTEYGGQPG